MAEWRQHLAAGESASDVATVRQYTHTGRPLGSEKFVADLEHSIMRALVPRKAGRPKKRQRDAQQDGFTFAA
jgi:putative transposase